MITFRKQALFLTILVSTLFGGCDVFNEDPVEQYDVKLLTDKVYVSEMQGSTTINLSNLIRAKVPVKFAISQTVQNGTLDISEIDKGVIKYSSAFGAIQADNFTFSILSSTNIELKQSQIDLVLADSRADLPCNTIIPFKDHFIDLGAPGTVVTLDVLENDWMCDAMKQNVRVVVADNTIDMTVTSDNKLQLVVPEWSEDDYEKSRYSGYWIELKENPSARWYADLELTFDDVCDLRAGFIFENNSDGSYGFDLPLATASSYRFNPLTSASLCGYSLGEVEVTLVAQPQFGTAYINTSKSFTYVPNDLDRATYNDLIIYKVSLPNGAWAVGTITPRLVSNKPCTQLAVDDVFAVSNEHTAPSPNGVLLPVIRNDCNSAQITSISIITPAAHGIGTVVTYFQTWSIMYRINDLNAMQKDVVEYEAVYSDGTKSRAKVYITPVNYSN
jgi:hypothetical protein